MALDGVPARAVRAPNTSACRLNLSRLSAVISYAKPRSDYPILLKPGSDKKFKSIIKARLRAVRATEEGVFLSDADFTSEKRGFAHPDNFAIGEDALTFYTRSDALRDN